MSLDGLPFDLVSVILRQLARLHAVPEGGQGGEGEEPLLDASSAAALAAAASACSLWRAACLAEVRPGGLPAAPALASTAKAHCGVLQPAILAQVRVRICLASPADALRLAASPGPPCTELQLPQFPALRGDHAAWAAQGRLVAAAEQLLGSEAFRRRSGSCLRALFNVPTAVAERLRGACFPALQRLALSQGVGIGSPDSLRGSSLGPCPPPALRELAVVLPAGGLLNHVLWCGRLMRGAVRALAGMQMAAAAVSSLADPSSPRASPASRPPGLERCCITAGAGDRTPTKLHLKRCACPTCGAAGAGGGGFWATLRSLRVDAAAPSLLLLDGGLLRLLRRCTQLRLTAGDGCLSPGEPGAAWAEPAAGPIGEPDLSPWLAAFAPVFAASMELQSLELQAAAASLHPTHSAGGSAWELRAGDGAAAWGLPSLEAAVLAPGSAWQQREVGLAAELRRPAGAGTFQLRVWRCEA